MVTDRRGEGLRRKRAVLSRTLSEATGMAVIGGSLGEIDDIIEKIEGALKLAREIKADKERRYQ